jgi:UDP-2,4-diacetamido-2,4,6-trideoxy-beta-L-altropyranose hydrolase
MPFNLVIRADANSKMGTGHLMRCLALAQAWQERGGYVTFLSHCENEALRRRIIKEGFDLVFVERQHPDPADLKQVLKQLKNFQNGNCIPWLVLDGYHFDSGYQKSIREAGNRLVVIDDYNHLPNYHADILLNQNIGAELIPYNCDLKTVKLFGPKYALLRTEFLAWKDRIQQQYEEQHRIMVTLGGADPENITLKVLKALLQTHLKEFGVDVIVGPANPNIRELEFEIQCARKSSVPIANSIQLLCSINMPEIMAISDVAISAGGSTCWELCFFGKPFLVLIAAENQYGIARGLDQVGSAICLGWHQDVTSKQIKTNLESLLNDTQGRRELSVRSRKVVDGQGRYRVLDVVYSND